MNFAGCRQAGLMKTLKSAWGIHVFHKRLQLTWLMIDFKRNLRFCSDNLTICWNNAKTTSSLIKCEKIEVFLGALNEGREIEIGCDSSFQQTVIIFAFHLQFVYSSALTAVDGEADNAKHDFMLRKVCLKAWEDGSLFF